MLTLEEIKKYHDKAYEANQTSRSEAAKDLVFYWVTHWDDALLDETQLAYRGEFDILRKAGRNIQADLSENPVQVDFVPINDTRDDAADLADGLYRKGLHINSSIEAFEQAETECIVCGVGAWLLHAKYESNKIGQNDQTICRRPIYEANNTVYWDPNSKSLDKADAKYVSVLFAYTEDGYLNLVKELTGKMIDSIDADSFKQPEQSYTFPWIQGEGKKIYVVFFYHVEEIKDKVLTFEDPMGETITLRESDLLESGIMDELDDFGYEQVNEQEITRNVVTKYVASGEKILKHNRIAGEFIPVIPCYGDHAVIEGEEHWEGVTRLAKDPQLLRDFALSYLGDLMSRSPRPKDVWLPEQISGFNHMYEQSGIDNNYPFVFQNRKAADGTDLPVGPQGRSGEGSGEIPAALPLLIAQTREATEDVANPGIPQDVADVDLSGKAVLALQARIDKQSFVYQNHRKHAKRRDGEVWASMAKELHDVPRKVTIELPDGTRKQVQIMERIMDKETGEIVTLHDINSAEFEVYSEISSSYSSQKEQTIERMMEMIGLLDLADPVRKILQLKVIRMTDGVDFDDIREYVNKQLVMMGVKKPETPEEEQMLAAQQQAGSQPDAAMVLAQAEDKKGQAALLEQQRKGIEMQLTARDDEMNTIIKKFEAMTNRLDTLINAQKVQAEIQNKDIDKFGKELDNAGKVIDLKRLTNEQLYQRISNG